ncbi:MAG: hypothetical protein ACWA5A_09270 [Marinibacterium sp.]
MGRHTGKDGIVKFDSGAVEGLMKWTLSENAPTADTTAAGDAWEDHDTLIPNWNGTIELRADHTGSGQDTRAGAVIAIELYSEGDTSGKTYWSGSATIEEHGLDSPYDNTVSRTYSFKGKGPLARATV